MNGSSNEQTPIDITIIIIYDDLEHVLFKLI